MSTIVLLRLGRLLLLFFSLSIFADFCACSITFFVIGLPSASSVSTAAPSLVFSFFPTFFVGSGLAFHSSFLGHRNPSGGSCVTLVRDSWDFLKYAVLRSIHSFSMSLVVRVPARFSFASRVSFSWSSLDEHEVLLGPLSSMVPAIDL